MKKKRKSWRIEAKVKKKRKSWRIEVGETPSNTNVFFGDEKIGFIQKLDFHLSMDSAVPTLRLTITDPKLVVTGKFNKAVIATESVCSKCGEIERIENKNW